MKTTTKLGDAANQFIASMQMDVEKWKEGIGYDLDVLDEIRLEELKKIAAILIAHRPRDWRDIEALAQIDLPEARQEVEAALHSTDPKVRQEAMEHAGHKLDPKKRERLLLRALKSDDVFGGLSEAIDEAAEFHPPAVVEMLLKGALNRHGTTAIHFSALLFYIHGKAEEPFDWNHRPFFLKFDTSDREERKAVFRELCEKIGVDASKYRATL